MDMERQVKLVSRNHDCTERGIVSLRNDEYPDLELDQIELQRRSLILPEQAIAIFRHYLKAGQPVDLVPWPSPDEQEWDGDLTPDAVQPLDETGYSLLRAASIGEPVLAPDRGRVTVSRDTMFSPAAPAGERCR